MNSLMNYGSDGENSTDSEDAKSTTPPLHKSSIGSKGTSDAIYDAVPMDMSEESNNNNSSDDSPADRQSTKGFNAQKTSASHKNDSSKHSSTSDQRRNDREDRSSSSHEKEPRHKSDDNKIDKYDKSSSRHSSDKSRSDDKKSRSSEHRDVKDSRRRRDDERKSSDKRKDKSSRDDDKSEKDHHYRDREKKDDRDRRRDSDRRDRDRDRDRDSKRDRVRERSRDRSREKSRERRHRDRSRHRDDSSRRSRERDRLRSRSRSRSRDRSHRPMSYREERGKNKLAQLEKLGIDIKATDEALLGAQEQNYYNPLTTATQGKYAEQIQKRKLLWANKKQDVKAPTATASVANTWVGTTFTHDQDGKVTAKFKRLMGIKGDLPVVPEAGAKPDILKKQEEMFSNMEQQYEVARATTHTQRGVGLGYASGFAFPR